MLLRTDYEGTPWIKPGRVYEAELVQSGKYAGMYKIYGELESPVYTRIEKSVHINLKDWEIVKDD